MRVLRPFFRTLGLTLFGSSALAGTLIAPSATGAAPARNWFPNDPAGSITLGGQFSRGAAGGYADSITGLWASTTRDTFLFLNSRYHYEDNSQFISSTGLALRQRIPGRDVILGINAYWDSIDSAEGNTFNQLGLGAEILTRWFDGRFNYYLPENRRAEIGRRKETQWAAELGNSFASGSLISQELRLTQRDVTFSRYEAALEGLNAEAGFLVPGLDRYAEVRLFAGYYHYRNPFGPDFSGFKARLEARLLPAVIADVEYWDDAALMGGHWTAGVRVSAPFSLGNLFAGKNPFEGFAEGFTPRQRRFEERMSEMVIRSHRIQTTTSAETPSRVVTQTQNARFLTSPLAPNAYAISTGGQTSVYIGNYESFYSSYTSSASITISSYVPSDASNVPPVDPLSTGTVVDGSTVITQGPGSSGDAMPFSPATTPPSAP